MDETKDTELTLPNDNLDSTKEEKDGIKEILEELPPSGRKKIEKMIIEQSSFGMIGPFSQESTISKKITEEHISAYLKSTSISMQKGFQERRESKIFTFALVLIALVFFIILIFIL